MEFKLMKKLVLEVVARRATAVSHLHVDAVDECLQLATKAHGQKAVNVDLRLRLSAKEDQLREPALELANTH